MSPVGHALLVNGLVLFAVLEADLGPHRRIGGFRVLRPLLLAAAIVPLFAEHPATRGAGLGLELTATLAGVPAGALAVRLMTVYRSPRTGAPVSRAGAAYAALWLAVIGARSAFSYGSAHWFAPELGRWMERGQVTPDAITDGLLLMAVAMTLTLTLGLAGRAASVRRLATA